MIRMAFVCVKGTRKPKKNPVGTSRNLSSTGPLSYGFIAFRKSDMVNGVT